MQSLKSYNSLSATALRFKEAQKRMPCQAFSQILLLGATTLRFKEAQGRMRVAHSSRFRF